MVDGSVMPGLIIGATLLAEAGAEADQGVYVRYNGRIGKTASYEDLLSTYPNAAKLDCRGKAVLSPGFVNAHEHTAYSHAFPDPNRNAGYEHRDEWRLGLNSKVQLPSPQSHYYGDDRRGVAKIAWTEIRHLIGGATTIAGSGGVPGLARNVGLQETEADLVVYDFEADMATFPFSYSAYVDLEHECAGGERYVFPQMSDMSLTNIAYVPHVGEGRQTSCAAQKEVKRYLSRIEAAPDRRYAMVHGVATNRQDYERMLQHNVTLIWSPRSNLALYGETIDISAALDVGVKLALGTDWSPSGSFNMREELACAVRVTQQKLEENLSHRELWQMATDNAAYALGLEDEVGSLRTGLMADLLLIRAQSSDPYGDVLTAVESDVLGVWVGGTALLLAPDIDDQMQDVNCDNLDNMTLGLCADLSSLDLTVDALRRFARDAVPLNDTGRQSPCVPEP